MKIILVILVLMTGGLITGAIVAGPGLRESLAKLTPQPPRTEVRVEPAATRKLTETVSAPGEIEPHTKVNIAAVVSAKIEELLFREGDEVVEGDIIARLDDRELQRMLDAAQARQSAEQASLRSSQSGLQGLRSDLDFAARDLERYRPLLDAGDVSPQEFDNALLRVRDLESRIESATHSVATLESSIEALRAEIRRSQDAVDNTMIRAPMDGIITWLNVEVGEVVTGSTTQPGTVLLTIADLSRMIMKAEVAESDVASVAVGQGAKIHINAYPDEVFSGTVRRIALQRSGNPDGTGYFETEVEIDLQGRRIYSGLVANVDIEIKTHEGIAVPYQSIVARDIDDLPESSRDSPLVDLTKHKATVVYRLIEGEAVCTPVKAGASDLSDRLVLEGLSVGDEVITGPFKVLESLKNGELVQASSAREQESGDSEEPEAAEATDVGETEAEPAPRDAT